MNTDWLRDVLLIPLATSLLTGVYTGFLVSRIIAFNHEIERARDRAFSCIGVFQNVINAKTETGAKEACAWLFFDITRALLAQPGQFTAADKMGRLSITNQEAMLEHWKKSVEYIKDGRPADKYAEIVGGISRIIVNETLDDIAKIKPNWGGLIFGALWRQNKGTAG